MRAVAVRCPQCHATLRVEDDRTSTVCEYCGTQARVQRTTLFGVPTGPPPAEALQTLPVALQRRARRFFVGLGLLVAISIAVPLFVAVGTTPRRPSRTLAPPRAGEPPTVPAAARSTATTTSPRPGWNGGGVPLFVDANGDGVRDAVGLVRYVLDGDRMHLAAIDGTSGAILWESGRLGTYSETYQGALYAAGTPARILFAHPRGELLAIEPRTGATAWARQLGERVRRACVERDQLALELANQQWLAIDVGAGTITPRTKPARTCAPLAAADDDPAAAPELRELPRGRRQPAGLSLRDRLEHVPSGVVVAAGHRAPGTPVPLLVRLDDAGLPRWTAEVPTERAFEARAERHGLSAARACAVYSHGVKSVHVTCFDVEDGTRLWDRELSPDHKVVRGLADVDGTVYVSVWGTLYGLDARTGAPRFTVGR